jgi:hypothetical protein
MRTNELHSAYQALPAYQKNKKRGIHLDSSLHWMILFLNSRHPERSERAPAINIYQSSTLWSLQNQNYRLSPILQQES